MAVGADVYMAHLGVVQEVEMVDDFVMHEAVRALHEDGAGLERVRVDGAGGALRALVARELQPLGAPLGRRQGRLRPLRPIAPSRQLTLVARGVQHHLHAVALAHALDALGLGGQRRIPHCGSTESARSATTASCMYIERRRPLPTGPAQEIKRFEQGGCWRVGSERDGGTVRRRRAHR